MYGLPSDVDLTFFSGARLLQVCIGENEVILNLHPGISVMIASAVRLSTPDGAEQSGEDARKAGTMLLPYLGNVIREATGAPDGTLEISWAESGHVLEIFDSWREFESYTIRAGERLIVV